MPDNKLETFEDRQAAGVDEPAEYAHHQEPPQNPDGGLPVALRGGAASKKSKGGARRPRSNKKK